MKELIILGTSAQVPTRERNHNGYFLRWESSGILFDPGEGTQRQMTYANLPASAIQHIAITHFHGDHCLGIPGVVQRLSLDKNVRPVHVYYPSSGQAFFDAMTHASLFQANATLIPHPSSAPNLLYEDAQMRIICEKLVHRTECQGYRIEEPQTRTIRMELLTPYGLSGPQIGQLKTQGELKLPNGDLIQLEDVSVLRQGQVFAHVMDTKPCDGALKLAKNADILLCEATYADSEEKQADEYMHMTSRQAAILAREANAQKLILTHFSQRYLNLGDHLRQAREIFPNTSLARDLDVFPFPKRIRNIS